MDKTTKAVLAEIANALSAASVLATHIRQTAAEHADDALKLEASVDRAIRAIKRLSPEGQ